MTIDRKEVEALIRLFERSDWHELRLETDGLKLVLSKDADAAALGSEAEAAAASAEKAPLETTRAQDDVAPVDGLVPITAPNLGTFYRAPKPGVAPYVEVGQQVGEATEVCLIEVMKLFTPVRAGINGRIAKACVEDGEMVEFGAPLFLVEPEAEAAEKA
ncbi:MAG: acetyl-CoA carboxylase biotin carboxyl carrier protein subunit [Rhodospirillales bacterium]|nr:acetyl-CoA carboxylase biotin carboxyl carrier protein subunit [Rhodospirillales bacterium]